MNSQTVQILIAMIIYMAIVVVIGVVYAKKANKGKLAAAQVKRESRAIGKMKDEVKTHLSRRLRRVLTKESSWKLDFVKYALAPHSSPRCLSSGRSLYDTMTTGKFG